MMYSEKRQVSPFTTILLKGVGNVVVSKGDACEVEISSNQNVVSKIRTEVINNELVISIHDTLPIWLVSFPNIDIKVRMKEIQSVRVTGVGKIRTDKLLATDVITVFNSGVGGIYLQLKAREVRTYLKGVGEIELLGTTKMHHVEISGTGKINAYGMEAEDVTVIANGVGECVVNARNKLDIKASGIGRVKYKGSPVLTRQQSGLGSIEQVPS